MTSTTRRRVVELAERHGLAMVGIAPADPLAEDARRMRSAVAAGRMARMEWMGGDRPAIATDPHRHAPEARSVIVVAAPYAGADRASWDAAAGTLPGPLRDALSGEPGEPRGLVARYALGGDYHTTLRARLGRFAEELAEAGIPTVATSYVDDRPLAERAFAARAGVGWIGKNTNLLTRHRAGSWVFIGALLSERDLPADEPLRASCGACRRCLDGCPTGALVAPRTIDAGRCISYLTIEHPGELDAWSSQAIGQWIFGCDVCQEVCPVNAEADDAGPLAVPLVPLGRALLDFGARSFERAFAGSALRRAGRHRLLRNVVVALENAAREARLDAEQRAAAIEVVEAATRDRRHEVAAHAQRGLATLLGSPR